MRISNKLVYQTFELWKKDGTDREHLKIWKRLDKTWVIYTDDGRRKSYNYAIEIKGNRNMVNYLFNEIKRPLTYPQHF